MSENLCQICGEREADFEGVICSKCKAKIDQQDFDDEVKAYEEDMLKYNHKGEWCWLTGQGKVFCQEGWCSECQLYLDWKESLRKVSAGNN